jgi:hypothetical protein
MRVQSFGQKKRKFPDHQAREFTNDECGEQLPEPCVQAMNTRFLTFTLISSVSP